MRPNIDISWQIHGAVRQYADERDLSIDEAYSELLRESAAYRPDPIASIRHRIARLEAACLAEIEIRELPRNDGDRNEARESEARAGGRR